jgi:hypothetical protein
MRAILQWRAEGESNRIRADLQALACRLPRWVCDQRIDRIQEMPKCVEPTLRANGVDDAEILATDTEPHAEADA